MEDAAKRLRWDSASQDSLHGFSAVGSSLQTDGNWRDACCLDPSLCTNLTIPQICMVSW